MSSPGGGKTSLLEKLAEFTPFKFAVIEGDLETSRDADRLKAKGINVEIKVIKKIYDNKMDNHLMDSPGQLLTHYSPLIESFILLDNGDEKLKYDEFFNQYLSTSVLIDFYAKNQNLKTQCLKYLDLSTSGSFLEASRNLFNYLRQAESTESAQFILLPNLNQTNIENIDAIFDRIYRAASGKFVKII
jgi:hypothetical protein